MKQIIVGNYYFGPESVQIVLREGTGGEYYMTPKLGCIARIKIGFEYEDWEQVLNVFFHEAFEMAFARVNCRYTAENDAAKNHDTYMFIANHVDFSEICARVAELASQCLNALGKAWLKAKKKRVKK